MSNQIIIAMSGRKGSGKNEIAKAVHEYYNRVYYDKPLEKTMKPVLECSFADTLKQFCIETLGLKHEQCYGSDDEKNTPTKYLWEDVVNTFIRWRFARMQYRIDPNAELESYPGDPSNYEECQEYFWECQGRAFMAPFYPKLKTGPMTGREIMQLFGTDLVRKTFGNVWAEATIRRIKKCDYMPVGLITDNRFPNEIKTVLDEPNGFIIRLTRSPYGKEDEHPSEAALDDYDWNRDRCFVLDNSSMSIEEQAQAIVPILDEITQRSTQHE